MVKRVCLVTGGTSGVGRSIARALARSGATVILVSRTPARGEAAAETLRHETGNGNVESVTADLSSMASVRSLAKDIAQKYNALHVLSNNAALLTTTRRTTPEGLDEMFATNYLGHFLLSNLLAGLLKEGAPSRVLTVSGGPGGLARVRPQLGVFRGGQRWSPLSVTVQAALAKVLFSLELARRLEGTGVSSNTFHPGLVRSGLPSHLPWYLRVPASFASMFFSRDTATGCFLAVSPEVEGVTGKFFAHSTAVPFAPPYDIRAAAAALWEESARASGLT